MTGARCWCENSHCTDHDAAACSRPANLAFKVDYVDTMCTECVDVMIASGGGGHITNAERRNDD